MSTVTTSDESVDVERWNAVFEAIASEPRRRLVVALLDAPPDESVPLPDAAATPTIPVDHRELRAELIHRHLPKLTDHDFVQWDREPFRARRGPRFEEVAVVFEALHAAGERSTDS